MPAGTGLGQSGGSGGMTPAELARLEYLEDNEYKILYFATISAAAGTITKPINSTILLDEFYSGGDAIVETLVAGKPSGQSALTVGGSVVSVSSFDTSGNFTLSGTPSSFDVALLYVIRIKAVDLQNVDINYEVNREEDGLVSVRDFSTGLTVLSGIVTANISTGITGGQTIYGGTAASENLTISSTTNATKGTIQIGTTDLVNIGNAATTSQRILRVGQGTSFVDIGSLVGTGTVAALYMNKATPSATNYTLHVTSGDTVALNGAFLTFKTSNTNRLTFDASTFVFTPGNASALALTGFSWTSGANINQTAATEIPGVNWNLRSRQWATGAITTQREFLLQAPTYSFVGASTITSAATFAITAAPIAGTNATITNSYSIWSQSGGVRFDDGTGYLRILAVPTITTTVGLFFNQATPSASNWSLRADTSNVTLNAPVASVLLAVGGGTRFTMNSTNFSFNPAAASAGASTTFAFVSSSDANQTAGTEKKTFDLTSATIGHATGAITTQRFAVIGTPTYTFAAASTITDAATFAITAAPIAGTNATITNSYSLWVQSGISRFGGNLSLNDAVDIVLGTTTGTKIGTGTTQKLGFWNAAPIVQPTTAVAASTFAANTSGIANDTATFDGYTIGQITKALRNLGILA